MWHACDNSHPRHFLNGCYLILQDADSRPSCPNSPDQEDHGSISSSLEESLLSLIQCSEKRWDRFRIRNNPRYRPFTLTHSWEPSFTSSPAFLSEGPSLVMSMKPNLVQKVYAGLQCCITQFSSDSWIAKGDEYFCSEYVAKSTLVEHETPWSGSAEGPPSQ